MDRMRKCELTEVELRDCVPIVAAVMDAIEVLVIVLDTEGRIVLFNHRCQKASAYSFNDGRVCFCWTCFCLPNWKESDPPSDGLKLSLKRYMQGSCR